MTNEQMIQAIGALGRVVLHLVEQSKVEWNDIPCVVTEDIDVIREAIEAAELAQDSNFKEHVDNLKDLGLAIGGGRKVKPLLFLLALCLAGCEPQPVPERERIIGQDYIELWRVETREPQGLVVTQAACIHAHLIYTRDTITNAGVSSTSHNLGMCAVPRETL